MTIVEHKWSALPVARPTFLPSCPMVTVNPRELPILETDV